MNALRRSGREEWERELSELGCFPLAGKGRLNTAEWWRYPWPPHLPFTVPVDEDGYADTWGLQQVIANIAKLAPPGWIFRPYDGGKQED